MEMLLEKEALVVNKQESLDHDDRESLEYEVMFFVDCDNPDPDHKGHITISMSTDDKTIFDKFTVGQKTDLKFLKQDAKQIKEIKKAN